MSDSTILPVFPPELIDAIISEIDDIESLKACSLVASSLRFIIQQILFSTLTIKVDNRAAISELLTKSPHIAGYVTNLIIKSLDLLILARHIEGFEQILAKLQNVRRCMLVGLHRSSRIMIEMGPVEPGLAFPPFLLDFLMRQRLHELSLICIHTPASALWYFLTTVPKLHFQGSVVLQDELGVAPTAVKTPVLHSLILVRSEDVGWYVVCSQNMGCLAALRHLSIRPSGDGWARKLIEVASRTLEHIHFDFSGHPPPSLPYLPVLRTLQFTFPGKTTTSRIGWGISETAGIMSPLITPEVLPALADVQIEQYWAPTGVFDPAPYAPLIALLEAALASYPTPPSIHWLLVLNDRDTQFMDFADTVRREMPEAHGTQRLVLEACVDVPSKAGTGAVQIDFLSSFLPSAGRFRI
ncbi:hypothetical protein MSAN_01931100 [Mycena sanguinolenta]|uniref:F-box domain-containing protein n=1 Tax=Mycena sanguinolenta TaxID=230812 RepID=A0A8H6XML2_9AGAR|nr:hypothetical protein MSAN_01931100 [Mycena sanguinolenta]